MVIVRKRKATSYLGWWKSVSRKLAPGKLAPRKLAPRKLAPMKVGSQKVGSQESWLPGKLAPRKLAPFNNNFVYMAAAWVFGDRYGTKIKLATNSFTLSVVKIDCLIRIMKVKHLEYFQGTTIF